MKRNNTMSSHSINKKRRHSPILKLENAHPVNSIDDLIELGKTIRFFKNLDTIMLWRITPYLEKLNNMIGMDSLKESILFQVLYYLKGFHLKNQNEEYLHTMILGPPGHGKTVVAKIIGQLYQSMGILSSSGPFKIANRDDFVAGYLGQTAIKTRELLKSCIGGVLFVDEVYSLGPGQADKDIFAKECMETITGFLSEHKNDFCFIGAGYEEDIKKCFFSGNKGLERRFQWNHTIEKYNEEHLTDILLKMVKDMEWEICVNRVDIIEIIKNNIKIFKNAGGDIETFLSKCKNVHAMRVFSLDKEHMFVFTKEDLIGGINFSKKYKLKEPDENTGYMNMFM
jgi:replication-associated recombination protein RarA